MSCPYCACEDTCGRERALSLPLLSRSAEVITAMIDLHAKKPWLLDWDPLYVSQILVDEGYFDMDTLLTLTDVGHAQDLIREVER
jgi:hypothetical protein